jgi:hypothetical protein
MDGLIERVTGGLLVTGTDTKCTGRAIEAGFHAYSRQWAPPARLEELRPCRMNVSEFSVRIYVLWAGTPGQDERLETRC